MQFKGLLIRACLLHIRACLHIAYEDRHSLYEVFCFLKLYIFEDLIILNALY